MARVTIKALQEEIETLRAINTYQTGEIKKLNTEIENLKEIIDSSEKKLNERNAGRKAYNNKDVIQVIYYLYLDGKSLQGIADELNNTEVRTSRGGLWAKSTIRFILLNSKNVTNKSIEKDIFDSAVKLLTDNRK